MYKFTDEELFAYLDGDLSPERAAEVTRAAEADAELAAKLAVFFCVEAAHTDADVGQVLPAAEATAFAASGLPAEPLATRSDVHGRRWMDRRWLTRPNLTSPATLAASLLLLLTLALGIGLYSVQRASAQASLELGQAHQKLGEAQATLAVQDSALRKTYKERVRMAEADMTALRTLETVLQRSKSLLKDPSSAQLLGIEIDRLLQTVQQEKGRLAPLTVRKPAFPGDKSDFVRDVTYPDDSNVPAGAKIRKVWRIRNVGTVPWEGRFLQREGPTEAAGQLRSDKRVPVPDTPPGVEVDVAAELSAPDEPGLCYTEWKMVDAEGNYLLPTQHPLYTRVNVVPKAQ
jgi:hypothetical protein